MKKTLVALAAVSAVSAFAQATIYGVIDQGYYSKTNNVAGVATRKNGIGDDIASSHGEGGLAGSRIGFKGTEDLGGGTAANFVYEFGLYPSEKTNASPISGGTAMRVRQGYVSLSSASAGELQIGRTYTHVWATQNGDYDFGLNNNMYGYIAGQNGSGNRQANAVKYISPNMNGFTAGAMVGFGETALIDATALSATGSAKMDEVTSFMVDYRSGPLKLTFANENTKNHSLHDLQWVDVRGTSNYLDDKYQLVGVALSSTNAAIPNYAPDATVNALGASYDFGKYKIGYHTSTMALQGDTSFNSGSDLKVSVNSLSGEATFGNLLAFGSYATAKNNKASQVNVKGTQLGARYLLSKRTDLYVITGSNKITKSDSSADYVTQSGSVFGIRHQF